MTSRGGRMTVCQFFLQGRCRYGERCWNEHPRGGGGGGRNQGRYQSPPPPAGGRSWSAQSQQYQTPPPSFNKSMTWTNKSREGGFKSSGPTGFPASQNRFSTLSGQDQGKDSHTDKDGNLIDDLIKDMESWQSSGQWLFSVYSVAKEKSNISGFTDISPEELRLEYNASQAKGILQNYMNSVQQMVNNWKQRVHELMNLNTSSRAALLHELSSTPTDKTPAFGGVQQSAFGVTQQSTFGSSGFGSSNAPQTAATFSFKADPVVAQNPSSSATTASAAGFTGFGAKPSSTFGFPVTTAPSASTFSFAATTSSTAGSSVFGFSTAPSIGANSNTSVSHGFGTSTNSSAVSGFGGATSTWGAPSFGGNATTSVSSGFGGFPSAAPSSDFGSKTTAVSDLFKSAAAPSSVTAASIFGPPSVPPTSSPVVNPPPSVSGSSTSNTLFTPRADLSAEDVLQFEAKGFTLGRIPLLPPPLDLVI